jgi:hypothetical protein
MLYSRAVLPAPCCLACRWYSDRFEVKEWQERMRSEARAMSDIGLDPAVYTLLGRTRPLPDLK